MVDSGRLSLHILARETILFDHRWLILAIKIRTRRGVDIETILCMSLVVDYDRLSPYPRSGCCGRRNERLIC